MIVNRHNGNGIGVPVLLKMLVLFAIITTWVAANSKKRNHAAVKV